MNTKKEAFEQEEKDAAGTDKRKQIKEGGWEGEVHRVFFYIK